MRQREFQSGVPAAVRNVSRQLTSLALLTWIAVWSVAAGVIVVTAVRAGDAEVVSLRATGEGEATLASVTARIESIRTSGVETSVVVTFTGREAEGDSIEKSRARLRLDDGSILSERWGSMEGRTLTMRFDPVPGGRAVEALVLAGVALADSGRAFDDPVRLAPVGSFMIGVGATAISRVPSSENAVTAAAAFGAGELIITRVVASGDQLAIHGRVAGYSRYEISNELNLDTPTLTLPDGRLATYLGTRIGFDQEDPGVFEMQFETARPVRGEAVLRLGTVSTPGEEQVFATLSVDLP
jgi:hypothetical protein